MKFEIFHSRIHNMRILKYRYCLVVYLGVPYIKKRSDAHMWNGYLTQTQYQQFAFRLLFVQRDT